MLRSQGERGGMSGVGCQREFAERFGCGRARQDSDLIYMIL